MPLVFITGVSTSGKSAIAKELSKHGYEAFDTEHNGVSAYFHKHTGKRAAEFGQAPERTEKWLSEHEWLISTDWVKQKVVDAQNKLIFLCGGSANEPEIRELCDLVIWLKTDEATIRSRVNNPRDHTYGTKPHELKLAIKENKRKEKEYQNYGAVMIDARQPLDKVIDDIRSYVK
jgi:shikimate kinase